MHFGAEFSNKQADSVAQLMDPVLVQVLTTHIHILTGLMRGRRAKCPSHSHSLSRPSFLPVVVVAVAVLSAKRKTVSSIIGLEPTWINLAPPRVN